LVLPKRNADIYRKSHVLIATLLPTWVARQNPTCTAQTELLTKRELF
jgi:hypothetical protein